MMDNEKEVEIRQKVYAIYEAIARHANEGLNASDMFYLYVSIGKIIADEIREASRKIHQ